ncbi:hypothetical protein D3C72_2159370 [compost metagenome]
MQGFGFFIEQAGEQGADHCVGIEFVEGGIHLQIRYCLTAAAQLVHRGIGGVLLTA